MLVTFKTDAHADITLFGDVALTLLKMMGHSGTVPSAILAEDVPAALNHLNTEINAKNVSVLQKSDDDEEPEVSINHRALPLIELLTAAVKAKSNVMWEYE